MKEDNIDNIVIMTLDAGGTSFVFSAMRAFEVVEGSTIGMPSPTHGTEQEAVAAIIDGFERVEKVIQQQQLVPSAISFAFPGPTDFENGVIGELENLPAFSQGGVPLRAYLEQHFNIPVHISNDGDLFTLGEALQPYGILTKVNLLAESCGIEKRYENLLGLTIGTGFGAGIVINGELLKGDNGAAGEINRMRNCLYPEYSVEYSVSVAGIQRVYGDNTITPEQIYRIAIGEIEGNRPVARRAFEEFAVVAADAIANAITLLDCIVVIGGGIAKSYPLFLPQLIARLNSTFKDPKGGTYPRLESKAYNLEIKDQLFEFLAPDTQIIMANGKQVSYNKTKRVGIAISKVIDKSKYTTQDTSAVIAMGAYAIAIMN